MLFYALHVFVINTDIVLQYFLFFHKKIIDETYIAILKYCLVSRINQKFGGLYNKKIHWMIPQSVESMGKLFAELLFLLENIKC